MFWTLLSINFFALSPLFVLSTKIFRQFRGDKANQTRVTDIIQFIIVNRFIIILCATVGEKQASEKGVNFVVPD